MMIILLTASLLLLTFNLARLLFLYLNPPNIDLESMKELSENAANEIEEYKLKQQKKYKELEELLEKQRLHFLGIKDVSDRYALDFNIRSARTSLTYINNNIEYYLDIINRYKIEVQDLKDYKIKFFRTKVKTFIYLMSCIIFINLNFIS